MLLHLAQHVLDTDNEQPFFYDSDDDAADNNSDNDDGSSDDSDMDYNTRAKQR